MAVIGSKNHVEVYINLPNGLKREIYTEFSKNYPSISKVQFSGWAYGKRPFPTLDGEWTHYLALLKKYDQIWAEQQYATTHH